MEKASSSVRFAKRNDRSLATSILGGLISFCIFAISFLVILSLIAYKNADPTKLIRPFSYTALCASAFVFGFTSSKLREKQGALVGLLSGLVLCLIVFAVSSAIGRSETPLEMALCLYFAMLALATIGGLAGMQKKHKKKRRRR